METQSGARTPLVDPFGRELEEWLRDAPATRAPYVPDLVVPPVTGPVQRPGHAAISTSTADEATVDPTNAPAHNGTTAPADETTPSVPAAPAFRRDRARHAAVCAPSFPEPPERLALRIEDLAVKVSSSTGRSSIERIVLLEDEVRRRDEDLARLAAWEATVAGSEDPEVTAARAFAHTVFADLLTDAAAEADRRDRAAARRAATAPVALVTRAAPVPTRAARSVPAAEQAPAPEAAPVVELVTPERDEPVRPVLGLPAVSPVSAATRPTPLVLPATGPTVIDRAAFAAALTAHQGVTASTPVVLPDAVAAPVVPAPVAQAADADTATAAAPAPAGWWSRLVDRLLGLLGRR
ncbi:hypothetical protein [Curtobacterium flaccumfaciens]|uniref:hypothetical protein n=1 Tax=Curtobacterium flaccumfaciens TaxID=2035 RepID=UPI001BDE67BB|nr:hypothetical protein [Curtobacterium flaccumfaciens]MBT1633920.1 hypothetical protein [Curtobacterium flaccumfaciens pv. oortii]MCX2843592.1 hypothetical protein [Curtobacterium flaccumfaciens pv. oortii]